jgi:hypothetical protein
VAAAAAGMLVVAADAWNIKSPLPPAAPPAAPQGLAARGQWAAPATHKRHPGSP